jgi:hypothetical protein
LYRRGGARNVPLQMQGRAVERGDDNPAEASGS